MTRKETIQERAVTQLAPVTYEEYLDSEFYDANNPKLVAFVSLWINLGKGFAVYSDAEITMKHRGNITISVGLSDAENDHATQSQTCVQNGEYPQDPLPVQIPASYAYRLVMWVAPKGWVAKNES